MEFTKDIAREVRTSIEALVQEFLEANYPDIKITKSTAGYDSAKLDVKLQLFSAVNGDTEAEADYKRYADLYELPLEMLGSTFNFNGKIFTVTGLLPNRRKNDMQIKNANGKTFIAPHAGVVRAYNRHVDGFKTVAKEQVSV